MSFSHSADSNLLAVHSVDEFVFSVPDLVVARHFYENFGLNVRDEEDGWLSLYTYHHSHRWGRIVHDAGNPKRLRWLTFGVYPQDFRRFAQLFAERNVPLITPPAGAGRDALGDALWVQGPDGLPIQLRVAAKCSPSGFGPREFPPAPGLGGRAKPRSKQQRVQPRHLSHVLMFTADVDKAREFYEGILGLRLSDRSGSLIAFLHTPHGSDHHLIALAKSGGGGLHHTSWCVPSIDEVGQGAQQMVRAGYREGWGLGRHVLGSNYFYYVRDPWGSYAEYSFDIDYIAAGQEWPAGDHPAEDSLYAWGPDVPEEFVFNAEINVPA
ncbi:VOC family protein [uncultured Pigmentiphaga sp.]|jgi:Predicted ring-cleavage extradiol dioxygenase|uniref:VOC family protein n=1 Tax=uncultured Pigmentiphaga sp. TaxID=340361 RepID=UPI00261784F7|nr:VOC family protein [uncultured Pigmentiphaga sp.]